MGVDESDIVSHAVAVFAVSGVEPWGCNTRESFEKIWEKGEVEEHQRKVQLVYLILQRD
jgi:hypothetical protein